MATQFDMDGFTPDRQTKPKDPDTEEQNRRLRELAELSDEERMKQLAELKDFFTDRGERKTEIQIESPPQIKRKKFKLPSGEALTAEQLREHNAKASERHQQRWNELKRRLQDIIDDESKSDSSGMSELDLNKEDDADEICDTGNVCVVSLAPTLRF